MQTDGERGKTLHWCRSRWTDRFGCVYMKIYLNNSSIFRRMWTWHVNLQASKVTVTYRDVDVWKQWPSFQLIVKVWELKRPETQVLHLDISSDKYILARGPQVNTPLGLLAQALLRGFCFEPEQTYSRETNTSPFRPCTSGKRRQLHRLPRAHELKVRG